jgi:predicted P-loop ATPase
MESKEGWNKSSSWRVLAGAAGDGNFSDERIIGKEGREVQEQLGGIWIHENADLAGMKKADIDTVKAYASRQMDIARPAYGRMVKKQKRHSIEVGTTNADTYLQSQTGNRRFWPIRITASIDLEKLKRDRLQLWGEAAYYQSHGESLVLDEALWAAAAAEQEARRVTDPWETALRVIPAQVTGFFDHEDQTIQILHLDHSREEEKVATADLLRCVLKIPPGAQRTEHSMRLANVMKHLGWERAINGYVTINKKRVKGYFRKAA